MAEGWVVLRQLTSDQVQPVPKLHRRLPGFSIPEGAVFCPPAAIRTCISGTLQEIMPGDGRSNAWANAVSSRTFSPRNPAMAYQHSNPSGQEDPEAPASSLPVHRLHCAVYRLPCIMYVRRNPHPDEAVYHFILFSYLHGSQG